MLTKSSQQYDDFCYYELPLADEDMMTEVLSGLQQPQKKISPKYFYNQRGSELFDRITRLPEYYQTRSELAILKSHREDIGQYLKHKKTLIEYGSGNNEKLRALIKIAMPKIYVPIEISSTHLRKHANNLAQDYPGLQIHAIRADYSRQWDMPDEIDTESSIAYFAGSSLGNFSPEGSIGFLRQVCRHLGKDGGLLIGLDNQKPAEIIEPAYNDEQGVTAAFNLNILAHLNHRLGSNFNLHQFRHQALYNSDHDRIEMYLISTCQQRVSIGNEEITFSKNEKIHTEDSYKFSQCNTMRLFTEAGLKIVHRWQDPQQLFSIYYATKEIF